MPAEVFNRSDEGVQFSATALFSLRRRYCSTRAAEVFNLVRHIQKKCPAGEIKVVNTCFPGRALLR